MGAFAVVTPWRQVWLRPRAVVRDALSDGAPSGVWLLPIASGMVQCLVQGASNNVGARPGYLAILLLVIPMGAAWGLIQVHMMAGMLWLTAKLLPDAVAFHRIRMVVAISYAPQSTALMFWLIASIQLGGDLYIAPETLATAASPLLMLEVLLLYLATVACSLWSMGVLTIGLAELRQSTVGNAFGWLLITIILFSILIVVLVVAGIMGWSALR